MFRLYCPQDRGFLTLYMVFKNSHNHKQHIFRRKTQGRYMYTVCKQNKNVKKAFSSEVLGQYINPSCPILPITFDVRFNKNTCNGSWVNGRSVEVKDGNVGSRLFI